jgi:hypothetical protein
LREICIFTPQILLQSPTKNKHIMYVAPLNFDLFFKKVFGDTEIARQFLQDFLRVRITKIKLLGIEYKITDDAVIVKFDYRCKINGEYVIIEMQQRYKQDVVKRFYLYHCVSTALQLETLKPVTITGANGKTYKEKDYGGIEPVLTLVWMVDDTLKFKDDFIVFTTLPEAAKDFIADETLWSQPLETIKAARTKTLKILNNKTKGLDFMQKNKIIYIFQSNIAKKKKLEPYTKWCILAELSKNPNNKKSDFDTLKKNKVMAEVIRKLEITRIDPSESTYISDMYQYEHMLAQREKKAARLQQKMEQAEQKMEQAEQKMEQAQKAEKERLAKAVHAFLAMGKDIAFIAGVLDLSIEETNNLAQLH